MAGSTDAQAVQLLRSDPTSSFVDGEIVDISSTDHTIAGQSSSRGLWVGGAGTVIGVTANGTTMTFAGIAAGTMLSGAFISITKTGTTATLMNLVW